MKTVGSIGVHDAYTTTIGVEVHAELKTKTKMFCSSANNPHDAEPNTHVCPVCLAHPGTLPVINREAVKQVIQVGLALGGEIASFTEFDRKNYFYPDIPKGYQISQYKYPLVKGGELCGVQVTRVHLEEDTARSLHEEGEGSLIDYNRAGVPLMELVTEPVIRDARTAANFARELQLLLRTLGVSDANMERGEMRVEANISVSKTSKFGTKVEVKNLNSFKSVELAIDYEIGRQIEVLEGGEKVTQETRGWDELKQKTFAQRTKESANDYRYFPEPDLPKMQLYLKDGFSISRLKENLPELPNKKRKKYRDLGLTVEQVDRLVSDSRLGVFFEHILNAYTESASEDVIPLAANYLVSDVSALLARNMSVDAAAAKPFLTLMSMLTGGIISSRVAKDLLPLVLFEFKDPAEFAKEQGLYQMSSAGELATIVDAVILDNPKVVKEYQSGKEAALQFLVGQGMKVTRGSANPMVLLELFKSRIR